MVTYCISRPKFNMCFTIPQKFNNKINIEYKYNPKALNVNNSFKKSLLFTVRNYRKDDEKLQGMPEVLYEIR